MISCIPFSRTAPPQPTSDNVRPTLVPTCCSGALAFLKPSGHGKASHRGSDSDAPQGNVTSRMATLPPPYQALLKHPPQPSRDHTGKYIVQADVVADSLEPSPTQTPTTIDEVASTIQAIIRDDTQSAKHLAQWWRFLCHYHPVVTSHTGNTGAGHEATLTQGNEVPDLLNGLNTVVGIWKASGYQGLLSEPVKVWGRYTQALINLVAQHGADCFDSRTSAFGAFRTQLQKVAEWYQTNEADDRVAFTHVDGAILYDIWGDHRYSFELLLQRGLGMMITRSTTATANPSESKTAAAALPDCTRFFIDLVSLFPNDTFLYVIQTSWPDQQIRSELSDPFINQSFGGGISRPPLVRQASLPGTQAPTAAITLSTHPGLPQFTQASSSIITEQPPDDLRSEAEKMGELTKTAPDSQDAKIKSDELAYINKLTSWTLKTTGSHIKIDLLKHYLTYFGHALENYPTSTIQQRMLDLIRSMTPHDIIVVLNAVYEARHSHFFHRNPLLTTALNRAITGLEDQQDGIPTTLIPYSAAYCDDDATKNLIEWLERQIIINTNHTDAQNQILLQRYLAQRGLFLGEIPARRLPNILNTLADDIHKIVMKTNPIKYLQAFLAPATPLPSFLSGSNAETTHQDKRPFFAPELNLPPDTNTHEVTNTSINFWGISLDIYPFLPNHEQTSNPKKPPPPPPQEEKNKLILAIQALLRSLDWGTASWVNWLLDPSSERPSTQHNPQMLQHLDTVLTQHRHAREIYKNTRTYVLSHALYDVTLKKEGTATLENPVLRSISTTSPLPHQSE